MNNKIIIRLVVFGLLAILSIIAAQTWWVINIWDLKEEEFHEKVNIGLLNVSKEFEKLGRNLPEYDLITRVNPSFYVVNINDNINAGNLEFFLRREMERVGIDEDFQYGIYNCTNQNMVWGELISNEAEVELEHHIREDLPVYDDEDSDYYFGVTFPTRGNWIINNMRPTMFLSLILALTTLFFMYSLFVILKQKRLSEMQKEFINNMTHEFKTPISTIRIGADTFLNNQVIKNDTRLFQYAQIIKEQNARLDTQVEKVLQIAKIEREKIKLSIESIELVVVLEDIVSSNRLAIQEKNGELEVELFGLYGLHFDADRVHFTNIVHNLLDNAIKYSSHNPKVILRCYKNTNGLYLEVEDNGIGISEANQAKIFDKFYRVPTGDVHNVKGFGIGLFYVKHICQAHGWKIKLNSEIGMGTKIQIKLF